MTPQQDRDLTDWRLTNSLRPADWRWKRASLLEDIGTPIRDAEDPWVNGIRSYLQDKRQLDTSWELADKHPIVYEVDQLFRNRDTTRWSLEAMIIAGVEIEEIANYFGFADSEIVRCYELCKYDIRHRLSHPGFIEKEVLAGPGQSMSEEGMLKLLGWIGFQEGIGPILVHDWTNSGLLRQNKEVESWYHELMTRMFQKKTLRGILRNDPVYTEMLPAVITSYIQLQRLDMDRVTAGFAKDAGDQDKDQNILIQSLTLSLASIDHATGVSHSAIEPRAADMIEAEIRESQKPREITDGQNEQES